MYESDGDHQMTSANEVPPGGEQSQAEPQRIRQHHDGSRSTSPRSDGRNTPTRRLREEVTGEDSGRGARRRVMDDVSARVAVPADTAVEGVDSQPVGGRAAGVGYSLLGATGAQDAWSEQESVSLGAAARDAAPTGVEDADARTVAVADAQRALEGSKVRPNDDEVLFNSGRAGLPVPMTAGPSPAPSLIKDVPSVYLFTWETV